MLQFVQTRGQRGLLIVGWLGCAAFLMHAVTSVGGATADRLVTPWLYDGVVLVAALVCATRALPGGRDRAAWLFLSIGLVCWLAGDAYWYTELVDLAVVPYPSPADGAYLLGYLAFYVALTLLVRTRTRGLLLAAWLDGIIGAAIAAALVAAVAFKPALSVLEGSAATVATTIAYPLPT